MKLVAFPAISVLSQFSGTRDEPAHKLSCSREGEGFSHKRDLA
jgi:hypothetical protein